MAKHKPSNEVERERTIRWSRRCGRWSRPQIEALAEQLEKDTGRTPDRKVFRDDIMHFDGRFWAGTKFYEKDLGDKLAVMKRVFHRCRELRLSVQEAIEAATPLDGEVMLADIQCWERAITEQVEFFQGPPRSVGRPRAARFKTMIHSLASIYEKHVRQPAGTGAFVRFVESVFNVVEPDDRHTALGETIKKILQARKKAAGSGQSARQDRGVMNY